MDKLGSKYLRIKRMFQAILKFIMVLEIMLQQRIESVTTIKLGAGVKIKISNVDIETF